LVIRGISIIFIVQNKNHFFLYSTNKITTHASNCQIDPTLLELEPVAGKKVVLDFSAPKLSSDGGLTLINQYEQKTKAFLTGIAICPFCFLRDEAENSYSRF